VAGVHDHQHGHPHPPVEAHNRDAGKSSVLLDIGDGVGALVVHAPHHLLGIEVELAPVDGSAPPSHVAVVLRHAAGRELPTAVFPSLPAGGYDVWLRPASDPPVPVLRVEVPDGAVREVSWPTTGGADRDGRRTPASSLHCPCTDRTHPDDRPLLTEPPEPEGNPMSTKHRTRQLRRPAAALGAAAVAVCASTVLTAPALAAAPGAPAATARTPYSPGPAGVARRDGSASPRVAAPRAVTSDGVVTNGGFENGDFAGWTTSSAFAGQTQGGFPHLYVSSDRLSTSGYTLPAPAEGRSQAVLDDGSGIGTEVFYQDITIPTGASTLSLTYGYQSFAPLASPPTLDYTDSRKNQQLRVDIVRTSAPVRSVAAGDVLLPVVATQAGDPQTKAPTAVSVNLAPLAGQTVRLRVAQADNDDSLISTVDAVRVSPAVAPVVPEAPLAVLLPGIALAVVGGAAVARRRRA